MHDSEGTSGTRGRERLGIIGFGPIGRRLVERFAASNEGPRLAALLVRERHVEEARKIGPDAVIATTIDEFVAAASDVAVECASPKTFAEIAPKLLAAGCDIIPLSLGAFAHRVTQDALTQAATRGPGRIEVPAGALGSIGFLAAGRENGLSSVKLTVAYPLERWQAMGAEKFATMAGLTEPTSFMIDRARAIALKFPGHMNVITAASLAGLGLDETEVELIADPTASQAWFRIEALSACGPATLSIGGRDAPVDDDPIDYTTFSVVRLLRRRSAPLAV
jgi:aspartate dehydrogenase